MQSYIIDLLNLLTNEILLKNYKLISFLSLRKQKLIKTKMLKIRSDLEGVLTILKEGEKKYLSKGKNGK